MKKNKTNVTFVNLNLKLQLKKLREGLNVTARSDVKSIVL